MTDIDLSGLEAVRSEVRLDAGELGERPQRGESAINSMRSSLGHLVLSLIAASLTSDDNNRTLAVDPLQARRS
ncbi:MAG: hypothetical protein ACLPVY_18635 [Acidimicrobiia bacterium]